MASIRRTLSPAYRDRHYQNGDSPSQRVKFSSPLPVFVVGVCRFVRGICAQRQSRKGQVQGWRRTFFKYLLFFLLGLVLGVMPFGHVDDIRRHDFSFGIEIKPPYGNEVESEHSGFDLVSLGRMPPMVEERFEFVLRKLLIVVTPTYNRALQVYYLNRLAQVLRLVKPPLLWIVVEMNSASMETADILRKAGVMCRHLVCSKNLTNVNDTGAHQRNTALEHIEHHKLDGIVYFAEEDIVYSLELFETMREISRFGTWPVTTLAQSKNKVIVEGPVCNVSQVIGWHTNEKRKRLHRFHVDMSGFAFNSTILWDPKRWRRPTSVPIRQLDKVKEGFQESAFVEQVVEDEDQMEGILPGCSRIMNWHLHLQAQNLFYPRGWLLKKNLEVVHPF